MHPSYASPAIRREASRRTGSLFVTSLQESLRCARLTSGYSVDQSYLQNFSPVRSWQHCHSQLCITKIGTSTVGVETYYNNDCGCIKNRFRGSRSTDFHVASSACCCAPTLVEEHQSWKHKEKKLKKSSSTLWVLR